MLTPAGYILLDGTPYDPVKRKQENERRKAAKRKKQPKQQEAAAADEEEEDDVEDDVEDEEDEDDEGTPLSQLPSPPPPMPPSPSPDRHHRRRRLRRAWSTHAAFVLKPMISTALMELVALIGCINGVARFHHRCMWIWYRYWKTRASELAQLGLCAAWQWQDKVVACPCCRTFVKVSRARSARAQGSVSE